MDILDEYIYEGNKRYVKTKNINTYEGLALTGSVAFVNFYY
jgi:hypothetical protein